jgi:hypothetical protein
MIGAAPPPLQGDLCTEKHLVIPGRAADEVRGEGKGIQAPSGNWIPFPRRAHWARLAGNDTIPQLGQVSLHPVSVTGPAAWSPGTTVSTLNILSGSPFGAWASPASTGLMS